MDITQRYDPELVAALQVLQGRPLVNWNDLPGSRQTAKQTLAALEASTPSSTQVTKEDRTVPGPQGAPAVPLRIYRPGNLVGPKPVLLWIHGGGYVSGTVGQNDALMQAHRGGGWMCGHLCGVSTGPRTSFPSSSGGLPRGLDLDSGGGSRPGH